MGTYEARLTILGENRIIKRINHQLRISQKKKHSQVGAGKNTKQTEQNHKQTINNIYNQ